MNCRKEGRLDGESNKPRNIDNIDKPRKYENLGTLRTSRQSGEPKEQDKSHRNQDK